MQVKLITREYECLLNQVPQNSPGYRCLERAVKLYGLLGTIPNEYAIECDIVATEALLIIARTHCPSAVEKLEAAVKELRYTARKP